MSKKDRVKIQVVTWLDASWNSGTFDFGEGGKLIELTDVGFLMREDEEKVVIASQLYFDERDSKYIHTIPKSCIKRRVTVGHVNRRGVERRKR